MSESASVEPPANPARPIESSRVLRAQLTLLGAALAFAALLLAWMYWKVQQGPHPLYKQGMAHIREKRWEEALAAFDAALERDDRHAPSWLNRAKVFMIQERKEEALIAFDRYLEMEPHDTEGAYYWRGLMHRGLGHTEKALADFRKAQPYASKSLKPAVLFALAEALVNLGKTEEAYMLTRIETRVRPQDAEILACHAFVRFRKGEVDEALADFANAQALAPGNKQVLSLRGYYLAAANRWEESLPILDSAIEARPKNFWNFWARSFSYWNLNRLEEARADWRKVMELAPMELLARARPDWAENLDPLALPMDRLPKQADLEGLEP